MVDGSLCRARHGRASETVHFPALRFVHATLSPRSRCGCVALRCGLLDALAAQRCLRPGCGFPPPFWAGWAVLLVRGFGALARWLCFGGACFQVSAVLAVAFWARLVVPRGGVAVCWCCCFTALRLWLAFGPGSGSRLPFCGLVGVCCGAGTALAFLARCALVGLTPRALASPFCGVGLARLRCFSRLWITLGSPRVRLASAGPLPFPKHGPFAAAYVRV